MIGLAALIPLISWWVGQRHSGGARDEVYESGLIPTGGARLRIPIKYYRIALFFLIFDLEVAFLFLWAVHHEALGWSGFWQITLFITILLIALLYPWAKGALDLVTSPARSEGTK